MPRIRDVRDNVSHHLEYSTTPRGTWSSPDLRPQSVMGSGVAPLTVYLVSYVPAPSPDGACHRIKVKVKRHHATVYARDTYCNTAHPLSDPLKGTELGGELERFAGSGQTGSFPVAAQASPLLDAGGANQMEIALEFPWSAVKRKWKGVNLYASVAVLGIISDHDGMEVARFSDTASTALWNFYRGPLPPDTQFLKDWELAGIPNHYTTQVSLPPGDYQLQVVVTDGESFGLAQLSLNVEDTRRQTLGISGVVLCNRIQDVAVGAQAAARAPQYIPLTGNGVEFSPAADTRFERGQRLFSYFEIFQSAQNLMAATEPRFQINIRNAAGQLKLDTGLRPVGWSNGTQTGIVPVYGEISIDNLPPGIYRLQVQASNSAGQKTAWRESSFVIQ